MSNLIRFSIGALIAYVIAAPLTSRISMDIQQTAWTDVWTYVIWLFGLLIWAGIVLAVVVVFVVIVQIFDRWSN